MVNVYTLHMKLYAPYCMLSSTLCASYGPLGQWWVYDDFNQSLSSEFLLNW